MDDKQSQGFFFFPICWHGTRMLFVFETIKLLVSGGLSSFLPPAVFLLLPGYNKHLHSQCTDCLWKIKPIANNIHIISLFASRLEGCQLSGTGNK